MTVSCRAAASPVRPDDTPSRLRWAPEALFAKYPHLRRAAAVPHGAERARSQGAWLAAIRVHDDAACLRADAWRNLHAVAFTLARRACWQRLTTRPSWDEIAEHAQVSRRTTARWIAWLRDRGLLGVVESGSTERYRRGPDDGGGNRAAEYLLTVPAEGQAAEPVNQTVTPTPTTTGGGCSRSPHARETASQLGGNDGETVEARPGSKAARRAEQHTQAQRIADSVPCLRRLSSAYVAWLARPFLAAGWTPDDVVWALNHIPDGAGWPHTSDVAHPAGWFRHRMRCWLDEHGRPQASRSQQLAAAADRRRGEQTRRREEATAAAAGAADYRSEHVVGVVAAKRAELRDLRQRRKYAGAG